jgi:metallo-beta-lactamase family protein
MKLTFLGAAGEVTGSAYLIETSRARVLIDCGTFQGMDQAGVLNVLPKEIEPSRIDAVLITHAHLDHTGRLPLLTKNGFRGAVFCTEATRDLARLILRDSAKIQMQDIVRINRRRERADEPLLEPLYTADDVEALEKLIRLVPYHDPVAIAPGIRGRFVEAGHLLGSTSIQLHIEDAGKTHCLVFSGDLGPRGAPLLEDFEGFQQADAVILESTYGDRDHRPLGETVEEFERIIQEAVAKRGKLLVPTFAVGRAQLLLYLLAGMFRRGVVPKFPVYVDSPMAIEASRIYAAHMELFDEDFRTMQRARPLADDLDSVHFTATAAESMQINNVPGPCLVMAGAGMCNAGRILHHLKQNLWRPETHVLIVGFQAEGTIGRLLVEGAKRIPIFGERIAVKAQVHTLGGFSAHAGQSDLLRWAGQLAPAKPQFFITHGETKGRDALVAAIDERFQLTAKKPVRGESVEF